MPHARHTFVTPLRASTPAVHLAKVTVEPDAVRLELPAPAPLLCRGVIVHPALRSAPADGPALGQALSPHRAHRPERRGPAAAPAPARACRANRARGGAAADRRCALPGPLH